MSHSLRTLQRSLGLRSSKTTHLVVMAIFDMFVRLSWQYSMFANTVASLPVLSSCKCFAKRLPFMDTNSPCIPRGTPQLLTLSSRASIKQENLVIFKAANSTRRLLRNQIISYYQDTIVDSTTSEWNLEFQAIQDMVPAYLRQNHLP